MLRESVAFKSGYRYPLLNTKVDGLKTVVAKPEQFGKHHQVWSLRNVYWPTLIPPGSPPFNDTGPCAVTAFVSCVVVPSSSPSTTRNKSEASGGVGPREIESERVAGVAALQVGVIKA